MKHTKPLIAQLLAIALLILVVTPTLAQGTVWTWTGRFQEFNGAGWPYYEPVTYCVYASGRGIKYVPAYHIYGGRLYCSPYLY